MASTFTTILRIEKQGTGENNATWGTKENNTYDLFERAIAGLVTVPIADANMALSHNNGTDDQSRYMMLNFTGALTADRTVTIPTVSKIYFVANSTSGGFSVVISTGSGTTYTLVSGQKKLIYTDGANVYSNDDLIALSSTVKRWSVPGYVDVAGIMEVGKNIDFHNTNADATDYSVRLGTDGTTTDLYVTPADAVKRKLWNDGNDGPGSLLDADTVDGQHAVNLGFPTGTAMLFLQTAAPTGWTKSTTHDNKALRIVSGTVTSGGSVAFTSAFGSQTPAGTVGGTALTEAQLATHTHTASSGINSVGHTHTFSDTTSTTSSDGSHTHAVTANIGGASGGGAIATGTIVAVNDGRVATVAAGTHTHTVAVSGTTGGVSANHTHTITVANAGSGATHTHTFTGTAMNLAVQYVDAIICVKN